MPDWSQVSRTHVLQAMEEYDRIGDREFLRRYGFTRSRIYTVWSGGQEYDSAAIVGAAYFHATGNPAAARDFDGEQGAAQVLREKGFDVAVNEIEAAAEERRAAARPARSTASSRSATPSRSPSRTRDSNGAGSAATSGSTSRTTASRPKPKKAAAAAPVLKICPTCNMALPASGICDFCD